MKKLKNLKEAEYPRYEDILGSDLFDKVQARSQRKYQRDITDNPRFGTFSQITSAQIVQGIMNAEKGYEKALSALAVSVVKQQFPSLEYLFKDLPFSVDAKIATFGEIGDLINQNIPRSAPEDLPQNLPLDEKDQIARIKNAITQGGSVKEVTFEAIEDAIDNIDPELLQRYKDFMTTTFSGMYQSEKNIATLMKHAAMGGGGAVKSGYSMPDVLFKENAQGELELHKIEVVARGIIFPILIHEIIKGLFALLQTQGSDENEDEATAAERMRRVGSLENEPRDLQIGQLIYESLRELLAQYDPRENETVRILFLKEVHNLERKPKEFLSFIKNLLDENLTTAQLRWCKETITDLKEEVKRFEAEKSLRGGRRDDLDETLTKTTEATMNTPNSIADYTPAQIKSLFDKIMSFDEGELEEIIKKQGSKYALYSHSGKKLGTHPSKEAARKQERAIYASKAKNESKSCSCGCNTCGH